MSEVPTTEDPESGTFALQREPETKHVPLPDVGVMPWLQVLGAFCLMFSSWGVVVSFGTFEAYYLAGGITDQSSASNIAWIGSLQAFFLMFGAALTGTLYDAGYFRQMMWTGSFLVSLPPRLFSRLLRVSY
jgi:hypothetical protein